MSIYENIRNERKIKETINEDVPTKLLISQ